MLLKQVLFCRRTVITHMLRLFCPVVCFRQKTSRVLSFEDFQRALEALAPKRFKGQSQEEALVSIFSLVEGKEPTNVGVTVRAHALFQCGTNEPRYSCM